MPDVRNDDQINDEHHNDDPNPQPEAPKPRRIRHPPDRLMYYGPGEAMAVGLFRLSVPPAETGWQPPPLPNALHPILPPASPYPQPISGSPVVPPVHPIPIT